ncbi:MULTISPECIES: terminase [Streptomyces]|uniref:terminase n=1 Tax=Streptomyces TaxID=1883 RepID=UPI000AF9FB5A|nr:MULTISPECIES: terminase [Streptomyces]MDP9949130.1 phage terminase large subunit-like protein [Streptomyces sp. DSM 41269]
MLAEPELKGVQMPRLFTAPPTFQSSAAQEAVELAAMAGLELFPWQQHVLDVGMRERADGKWSAFECCVNVPRQNGKGGIIEARELAGLFLLKEHLIVHSAHEFKTSRVAFQRIHSLIMGTPDLRKRVKRVLNNTTETSITLVTGQSLQFIARSGGSGRGWTGDLNILDEAMSLGDDAMGALMPTMSAVPNPQLWYLGSAGIGGPSVQLGRLRRRALAALEAGVADPSLAYFEWSVDPHVDECPSGCTDHDAADDPASWAKSNPSLGYLISHEFVRNEQASLGSGGIFERERLGVGAYPSDEADTWQVIGEDAWRSLAAAESAPEGEVVFAIDATPEQDHAAIAVAGRWRGGTHIEIAHHQPGMGWVVAKAKRMQEEHKPRCWVVDAGGPAGSLIQELEEELGITVVSPKMREVAQAAGQFFTAVADQSISHIDQPLLATALAGAQKRPLGDAWAWARRGGGVDISPLVAATHAKWGLGVEVEETGDVVDNVW